MVLNSIGVYGFLPRAHLEHALAGDLIAARPPTSMHAYRYRPVWLRIWTGDFPRSTIDTAIEQTTAHGRGKAAIKLADQQKKNRGEVVASRTTGAGKLASLKGEKAEVEGERKSVEADRGPVQYLATLLGSTTSRPCGGSSSWWCCWIPPLYSCSSQQRVADTSDARRRQQPPGFAFTAPLLSFMGIPSSAIGERPCVHQSSSFSSPG